MEKDKQKHILRKYLDGSYLKKETDELHEAFRKENFQSDVLNELTDEVWSEGESQPILTPMAQMLAYNEAQRILHRAPVNRFSRFKRASYAVAGMAAAVLLSLGSFHLFHLNQEEQVSFASITTSYGERKEITLSDGSRVILNACSSLEYPNSFKQKERKVHLKGEAFFKVAKNEKKPFRVVTEDLSVKVLGTGFNVKSYPADNQVSVDVESGKVEVSLPEATLRLKKQERVWVNTASGEFNKKQEEDNKVAVWRKGGFGFRSTPIQDVARELERSFHCRIEFAEGQHFNNVVTGELESSSLESVLESISFVCGLNYRMESDRVVFYKE